MRVYERRGRHHYTQNDISERNHNFIKTVELTDHLV